jgi:predicted DCC family thiol-disulfide oxidoreductase YuxK
MIEIGKNLPPHLKAGDQVILFDGVCKLCNAWSNFIIRHDKRHNFKLASVQSRQGIDILRHFKYPVDSYETMLVVYGETCLEKTDAVFYVMKTLGHPWALLSYYHVLPPSFRDWFYDRIALNRYKLFGKYDYCTLPSADHAGRYLNGK